MHIFGCVLIVAAFAPISTGQLTDQNPNCPRMAQNGGCEQADVLKYCQKSCKDALEKARLLETLKITVEGLVLNLTRVETQNRQLERQNQQHETSQKQLEGELAKLKAENQGQNNKTQALETKNQALENQAKALETKTHVLEKKVQSLKTTGAGNTAEISTLKTTNTQLKGEVSNLKTANQGQKTEIDSLKVQLQAAQETSFNNTAEASKLKTSQKQLEGEISKLKAVNQGQYAKTQALETKNQALESQANALETQAKALETKTQSLEVKNQALETQTQALETKAQGLEKEVQSLKMTGAGNTAEISTLKTQLSQAQRCCAKSTSDIQSIKNTLQKSLLTDDNPNCPTFAKNGQCHMPDPKKYCRKSCDPSQLQLLQALQQIQTLRTNQQTSLTGVRTEVTLVKKDLTSAQTAIQDATKDRVQISSASKACCTNADRKITTLENTLQTSVTEVTKMKTDLTSAETAIKDATKNRVQISTASQACCTNADKKITALRNNLQTPVTAVQNEVSQLKNDLTVAQNSILDAAKDRVKISTSVTGVQTEVAKVKSDLTSAQTAILDAATDRVKISNASLACCAKADQRITTLGNILQTSLGSFQQQVALVKTDVTSTQTSLLRASTGRSVITNKLSGLQREVDELRTNVSSATSGVNGAAKDRASISVALTSIEQEMTQMKLGLTSAQKDIVNAAKSRATIATELTGAKKCCADNTKDVTTLSQTHLVKLNQMQQSFVKNTDLCDKKDQCLKPVVQPQVYPFDCCEVHRLHGPGKGVFTIRGHPAGPTDVYCEDGYTVLMRRTDDDLSFSRPMKELASALGKPGEKNFWIGLEAMHYLTTNRLYKLLVEVTERTPPPNRLLKRATYKHFSVGSLMEDYQLTISSSCTGNGCDGFDLAPSGTGFSSKDRDVDTHNDDCADYFHGAGFWYTKCGSSLTAPFCGYQPKSDYDCALWRGGVVKSQYIASASMLITAVDP